MKKLNLEQMSVLSAGRSALCTMEGTAATVYYIAAFCFAPLGAFALGASIACAYHLDE